MQTNQSKISIFLIFLYTCVLLTNAYPVNAQQRGKVSGKIPRALNLTDPTDRWMLELERITESPGVDQWVGGQTGQGMEGGFRNVILKHTIGKATIDLGALNERGVVHAKEPFSIKRDDGTRLRGTIAIDGSLEEGVFRFKPSGRLFTLVLADGQSFPMEEVLFSEPNVDFSIEMPFEAGAEAITSFSVVDQLSNTPIKVTITWRIKGPEEQVWEVHVTGHEKVWQKYYYTYEFNKCQEPYGERLKSPKGKQPQFRVVENKRGAVFRFQLTAEVTLKKKKGRWYYSQGKITQAKVFAEGLYTPEALVQIKKVVCTDCANIIGLPGSTLPGKLSSNKLQLFWPDQRVSAKVYACSDDPCLRAGYNKGGGIPSCKDLGEINSRYLSTAPPTEFMYRMEDHKLELVGVPQKFPVDSSLKAKNIFEWNYTLVKLR